MFRFATYGLSSLCLQNSRCWHCETNERFVPQSTGCWWMFASVVRLLVIIAIVAVPVAVAFVVSISALFNLYEYKKETNSLERFQFSISVTVGSQKKQSECSRGECLLAISNNFLEKLLFLILDYFWLRIFLKLQQESMNWILHRWLIAANNGKAHMNAFNCEFRITSRLWRDDSVEKTIFWDYFCTRLLSITFL